ncbi:MAG: SDR family NAD(P)-dependent oxidoreductase, partial [Cryomorphaceae bacterium]|nr:SDR family NAD(P)-dependent oxidoreductase [Cryomorphaceae bacterium]
MSKNVIITGTSRGIGLELIKLFSNSGFNVLSLSRNITNAEKLNLNNTSFLPFDITKENDHLLVNKFISKNWKSVDILINNAGLLINKSFQETSFDDFNNVYNTNVFGVARLIQVCLPFMKKNGQVINISSIGGVQGSVKFPGLSAYSSSKGALITLT